MTQDLVKQIMEKPSAAIIVQHVQDLLAKEQRKRKEFYEMIDEDSSAEFINGEVVFHSPVMKRHTDATKLSLKLLDTYVVKHDLGYVGVEKSMVALTRNDYEPDLCFFNQQKAQHFRDDQLIYPIPDFVVEVLSKSNQQNIDRDRVVKFDDYQQHQMLEYWIVDPELKTVEQYLLENKKYELKLKAKQGNIKSEAVKDFEIPIAAIFDKKLNQQVLKKLL